MRRGEECVSLGWTFWHRGCYGCLFCGNKGVARGLTVRELYEDEDEDEEEEEEGVEGGGKSAWVTLEEREKRGGGRVDKGGRFGEADDSVKGGSKTGVVGEDQRGLKARDRDGVRDSAKEGARPVDKGMIKKNGSRGDVRQDDNRGPPTEGVVDNRVKEIEEVPVCANCLVDLEAEDERQIVKRAVRRVEKGTNGDGGMGRVRWERREVNRVVEERLERTERGDEKQQVHLHKRPIVDGPSEQEKGEQDKEADTIYVSLTDPLGEMSFRPSPTKPIPEWMRLNSGHTTEERNNYKQESSIDSTICPDDDKSSFESRRRLSGELSGVPSLPTARPQPQHRRFLHRGTSFVSAEPLTLPSSLAHQRVTPTPAKATLEDEMSNTSNFSVYMTPPEYPSPPGSSSRREESNDSEAAYTTPRHFRVNMIPQPQQSRLLIRHSSNLTIPSQPKTIGPTTDLARHSTTSLRPHGTPTTITTTTHIHRGGGLSANASVEYLVEPFEKRLQRQREREKELMVLGFTGGQAGTGSSSRGGRGGTIKLRAKTFLEHLDLEQEREREREREQEREWENMEREAQPAPLRLGSSRQGGGSNKEKERERLIRQDDGNKEKESDDRLGKEGRRKGKEKEATKEKDRDRNRDKERDRERERDKEKEKKERESQTSSGSKLKRRNSLLLKTAARAEPSTGPVVVDEAIIAGLETGRRRRRAGAGASGRREGGEGIIARDKDGERRGRERALTVPSAGEAAAMDGKDGAGNGKARRSVHAELKRLFGR